MIFYCHSGYVTSKNDKDRHYVPAHQVAVLYGVVKNYKTPPSNTIGWVPEPDAIHLWPDSTGKYDLEAILRNR